MRRFQFAFVLFISLIGLIGCSANNSNGDPAKTVESYLQAKVASDGDKIRGLLCASMEAQLARETASFKGVQASIQGMSCQRDGQSDIVRCTGKIVAVYNGENQDFPLGAYHVVQEDSVWKWCGVAQ